MNNKNQRMNDFFDFWRTIVKQNPDFDLNLENNMDSIYSTLVFFDTKPDDNDTTIAEDGIFDSWSKYYQNNKAVTVSVEQNNPCYCYFSSTDQKLYHANECLIVYVPLDHDHIENGVHLIVDYLSQNNIAYIIKVNKKIRSDNIVVNLNDQSKLKDLCHFIEQTPFIQEGLIKPNPFIYHYKNLAIGTGNTLSYNYLLAQYIKLYLQTKRQENNIDQISAQDFMDFISHYYNESLINNNADEIIKLLNISHDNNKSIVLNIKNITELIMKSNQADFTFEHFIEHYNKYNNQEFINQELTDSKKNTLTEEEISKTNNSLKQAFNTMQTKFGHEQAIKRLQQYIYCNQEQLITRDNNLRSQLVNSPFRVNMLILLKETQMSLTEYLDSIEKDNLDTENIDIILNEALEIMSQKYSYEQSIQILERYIKTNNINLITRTDNLRNTLINFNFRNKILKYLEVNNRTLTDYLMSFVKETSKEDYLRQAMTETYDKYEKAYQDGTIENSGSLYVESALKQLLCNNSYKGFTRDNGIRTTLSEQVSQDDAIEIIKQALSIDNAIDKRTISLESANYMVKEYMELVLSEHKIMAYNK